VSAGNLFDPSSEQDRHQKGKVPLAERMRPSDFSEFLGQEELVGEDAPLRRLIEQDRLPNIIFWGPPGCGKTTLARLIAKKTGRVFEALSAVTSGVADVRRVVATAKRRPKGRTILFIDEIHRFNKAQQDALLPHLEDGTLTLIGATTENPSFEVIPPLLSRCKVFLLHPLEEEHIRTLIEKALVEERGLSGRCFLDEEALSFLVRYADGDARRALNLLEMAADATDNNRITVAILKDVAQRPTLLHDKSGDYHYDLISALHKALRGSDVDAALYWLARLLEAGEDPLFVARRLVRAAAEDIGLADPFALVLATAAYQATHFIGMPEANCILAEAVIYLATAPKSNSAYTAYSSAANAVHKFGQLPVPLHIRNDPTPLMRQLGYAKGYKYPHSFPDHIVKQTYLPNKLKDMRFYRPSEQGREAKIAQRWEHIRRFLRGESDA